MNCEEICDSTSDYGFDYYDQTANILCGHDDFERILDTNSNLDSSKHCCLFGEQIGYVYKDTCKVYSTFNLFVFQKLLQNIVTKYLLISHIIYCLGRMVMCISKKQRFKGSKNS